MYKIASVAVKQHQNFANKFTHFKKQYDFAFISDKHVFIWEISISTVYLITTLRADIFVL